MQTNLPVQLEFTTRFQRDVRTLAKRYRAIRSDIQVLFNQLQAGEVPGDQVPGMDYTVFKVRVKNSAIQKGKSAGYRVLYYRVLYYLKTNDRVVLVTMYSKSDRTDIPPEEVRDILKQYEQ
jgi:mRNA-degrading endonuclease RelE of RelBE toxin-antitoxin system